MRAPIPLIVSRETGPALCWSRAGYRLVVPESLWAGLSTSERSAILRHELEHYRRGDLWTALLARGLVVLHWFNPLAWWAVGRFEAQAEFLCDRAASVDDPSVLASMLFRLGSRRRERTAIVQSAGNGGLFERIQRLMADAPQPARWKCALPVVVSVVALGIMAVRLQAVGVSDATTEPSSGLAGAADTPAPLPPRALVRIGTDDLRTGRRLHHDERTPGGYLGAAAWSATGDRIVTGDSDGVIRVWEATTGKLVWYKPLAPTIGVLGANAGPAFVAFSHDGKYVVAAGRRDDPVRYSGGIVAVYEAASGRTLHEVPQQQIRWAALAPDGRMVVVGTSHGGWGDRHFVGVEVGSGRTRWTNPPAEERVGFVMVAGMQFQPNSSFLEAAMRDGNVIRFNALTGREQRRFLADGRTPEPQKAGRRGRPDIFTAAFSDDGHTMVSSSGEWICVRNVEAGTLRRRIRYPNAHGCFLTPGPRRQDRRDLGRSVRRGLRRGQNSPVRCRDR